jgi:hypothetical protein
MAGKYKTIYLLLALACFLGIIAIFVFDGYMGVYDTLRIDNGQFPQTIATEQWQQQEEFGYPPTVSLDRDRSVNLTYIVENHRFSTYSADVAISLWDGADKVGDVAAGRVSADAFGSGELTFTMNAGGYIPADYPPETSYNLIMLIERGGVERRVSVYINPGPPKTITIQPPGR